MLYAGDPGCSRHTEIKGGDKKCIMAGSNPLFVRALLRSKEI